MARLFSYVSALLYCSTLLAQSATNTPPATQVHISGKTRQCGKSVPGMWWVRFDGKTPLASRIVKTDDRGKYEADLPLGIWTMTLLSAPDDTTEFVRPRHFQVNVSRKLVFNVYLRPPVACSVLGTPEQRAADCWGEEFYRVPSSAGVSFEVDLFGLHQHWTPCLAVEAKTKTRHREFATYNLFSVEADNVAYHPSEQILEANGDVLMQDESGEHKADSVRLRIQDGHVSALPQDR